MMRSGRELLRGALKAFLQGGGTLVGEAVGVHGVTSGLEGSLVRTPLSEAAAIGVATGLALAGKGVVVELIDPHGLARATDVLVDLASLSARSGGAWRASVVILAPYLEISLPAGLTVGVAGVAEDLPGLLSFALASGGPHVLFVTASALDGDAADAAAAVPGPGVSVVRKVGGVTVLTAGDGVRAAMAANADAEVVDLRGVAADPVALESVRRTGRAVAVGVPAALLSVLNNAFLSLESPLVALSADATPEAIAAAVNASASY